MAFLKFGSSRETLQQKLYICSPTRRRTSRRRRRRRFSRFVVHGSLEL